MDASLSLILLGTVFLALSGVPAVVLGRRSCAGAVIGAGANVAGGVLALAGMIRFWRDPAGTGHAFAWQWSLPLGRFAVGLDALGVVFLIPVFLIAALGSIYGLTYWPQRKHPGNGRKLRLCWGLLAGAMGMIVLARDAVLFLMAWEIMALAAFMLVATEDYRKDVRKAAWVYLVATHVGTLCLFGLFALLRATTGTTELWAAGLPAGGLPLTAILVLALVGFGMKAGLVPLHVWLPGAHANAPSHVSAVLSGVMLKMGVYGLFRVAGLVAVPPIWWGAVVLVVGAVSALLGIAYAVGQNDYKRLLAYSSIENIGIVAMGLGLALLGRAAGGRVGAEWVVLGAGAALLHVLNHSLFKPLLFMGAGNLLHAVHTRRMDQLGGLAKKLPVTFGLVVVGAVAICGLPPLNGFVSELLLYVGLLKTTQAGPWGWAALGVPALAAVGAFAVTGFVKLVGAVFLGEARGGKDERRKTKDERGGMVAPMGVLAGLCVGVGLVPTVVVPLLDGAVASWSAGGIAGGAGSGGGVLSVGGFVPLGMPTWTGVALVGGVATVLAVLALMMRGRRVARSGTWDCGYARPTARMQYTGSSWAQMAVDLAGWALWPRGVRLRLQRLFPAAREFRRELPDVMLERVFMPFFALVGAMLMWLRGVQLKYQQRSVQTYLVYVMVIIVVLVLVG